jgi:hypothetical protein
MRAARAGRWPASACRTYAPPSGTARARRAVPWRRATFLSSSMRTGSRPTAPGCWWLGCVTPTARRLQCAAAAGPVRTPCSRRTDQETGSGAGSMSSSGCPVSTGAPTLPIARAGSASFAGVAVKGSPMHCRHWIGRPQPAADGLGGLADRALGPRSSGTLRWAARPKDSLMPAVTAGNAESSCAVVVSAKSRRF